MAKTVREEKLSEIPQVSPEFIEESKLCQTMPKSGKKRGGRYTRDEIEKRRGEVYRLHFEYGYSARKISELMKLNRNTINADVDYWYSQVTKKQLDIDPTKHVAGCMERLELQRSHLREEVDKVKNLQERISIEHLIFDIDSKIIQTQFKLYDSASHIHSIAIKWFNNWMKKSKNETRYMTWFDLIKLSDKAHDKVNKILKEDSVANSASKT